MYLIKTQWFRNRKHKHFLVGTKKEIEIDCNQLKKIKPDLFKEICNEK